MLILFILQQKGGFSAFQSHNVSPTTGKGNYYREDGSEQFNLHIIEVAKLRNGDKHEYKKTGSFRIVGHTDSEVHH